jgi:putative RNase toxin 16 of polymorphic toxin system
MLPCGTETEPLETCAKDDDCLVLAAKAMKFLRCVTAREARENKCFRGGDRGHKQQIQQRRKNLTDCNTYLFNCNKRKCPSE